MAVLKPPKPFFNINDRKSMSTKKVFISILLTALGGMSTAAMADDLLDTMDNDGGYKTLLSAIHAAKMEKTFQADGPITLFAPTDRAFSALPKGQLDKLLADKTKLQKTISYWVIPKKVDNSDVSAGKVKTLEGEDVSLAIDSGAVKVNDAHLIGPGTAADNGVIHAMDKVIMPHA
jgi:uncharacterized surface protein with fasciclin (FAS1) repeats